VVWCGGRVGKGLYSCGIRVISTIRGYRPILIGRHTYIVIRDCFVHAGLVYTLGMWRTNFTAWYNGTDLYGLSIPVTLISVCCSAMESIVIHQMEKFHCQVSQHVLHGFDRYLCNCVKCIY
jgi:hypothetical protein